MAQVAPTFRLCSLASLAYLYFFHRTNRSQHTIHQMVPERGYDIRKHIGEPWNDISFILYYKYNWDEEQHLKDYNIPDLSDIPNDHSFSPWYDPFIDEISITQQLPRQPAPPPEPIAVERTLDFNNDSSMEQVSAELPQQPPWPPPDDQHQQIPIAQEISIDDGSMHDPSDEQFLPIPPQQPPDDNQPPQLATPDVSLEQRLDHTRQSITPPTAK